MRKGTRTVLSMQNNYKGPPDAFAMVIPVPVVLKEQDVKTLPPQVFAERRAHGCAAPRRVLGAGSVSAEPRYETRASLARPSSAPPPMAKKKAEDLGVTVEAQFSVGEYQIVILSAKDSTGLDTWLRREKYNIPKGAEPLLRPYVESGSKFFVAKVDPKKVKFVDGRADAVAAALPLRQRAVRAADPARAREQRRHAGPDRQHPGPGPALRGRELQERHDPDQPRRQGHGRARGSARSTRRCSIARSRSNPGAVVTEYAWQASTCDPCPGPALTIERLHDARRRRPRSAAGDRRTAAAPAGQPTDAADAVDEAARAARVGHGLRADPPPRALRQGPQGRSRVPRGAADRRRPRIRAARRQARRRCPAVEREQLPGPLRDPPSLDRSGGLREPAPWHLGRPAERRPRRTPRRRSTWHSRRAARSRSRPRSTGTSPSSGSARACSSRSRSRSRLRRR